MGDLFGVAGTALLDGLDLPAPYAARIALDRRSGPCYGRWNSRNRQWWHAATMR